MKSIIILVFTVFFVTVGINETYGQTDIPDWVKNVAGFWANGDISDQEYAASITYLAENNIITIPQPEPKEPTCDELFNEVIETGFTSLGGITFYKTINEAPYTLKYSDIIIKKIDEKTDEHIKTVSDLNCYYDSNQRKMLDTLSETMNKDIEIEKEPTCEEVTNNAVEGYFSVIGSLHALSLVSSPEIKEYMSEINDRALESMNTYENSNCRFNDVQQLMFITLKNSMYQATRGN